MRIIGEIKTPAGTSLFRMFESEAMARRGAFRIHHHVESELGLIEDGEGVYKVGDSLYEIKKGSLFFFKSNQPHCITDISGSGMRILNIYLSPRLFSLVRPSAQGSSYFAESFVSRTLQSHKLNEIFNSAELSEIYALIYKIRDEFLARGEHFEIMCENYLKELLVLIYRKMTGNDIEVLHSTTSEAVYSVASYIDGHYAEPMTLASLAELARLEKTYFDTIFKRKIGISVWDYVLLRRIENAVKLLKTTSLTVLEGANRTGFNNTANFNKIFKKYTGTTPRTLRGRGV
ncbi:MAG: helix-turn-helix transcriptional regulator [Clostridia bacterium]|nr:helix-turn-helix transcriptional regulator [Clostridia bacterium]